MLCDGLRMCRECSLALFNSKGFALCPLCRTPIYRKELLQSIETHANHEFVDFEKDWKHSSKTQHLVDTLEKFKERDPEAKVCDNYLIQNQ